MRQLCRSKMRALVLAVAAMLLVAATPATTTTTVTPAAPPGELDVTAGYNPIRKLGRGLSNTVLGVMEIPVEIYRTGATDGPLAAFSVGVFYGIGAAITRTAVGAIEIGTFLFPLPDIGYGPIIKPEFLFHPLSS